MSTIHETQAAERRRLNRKSEGLLVENAELRKQLEAKTRQLENFMELYEQKATSEALIQKMYLKRGGFLRREQHENATLRRDLEYQKNLYSTLMLELDVLIMQEEQDKLEELKKKVVE